MKEGLSLLCKTGSGLAHAYVKLEVKERCVVGGPDEDCEIVGPLSPFPLSFLGVLAESLTLLMPSGKGREGQNLLFRSAETSIKADLGNWRLRVYGGIPAGFPHLSFRVWVLCPSQTQVFLPTVKNPPTFSYPSSRLPSVAHSSPHYKPSALATLPVLAGFLTLNLVPSPSSIS